MSIEQKYQEMMEQFKVEASKVVAEHTDRIYFEMLPFIGDDVEQNAILRASDIVNAIIRGNFTIEDGKISYGGWRTSLTSCDHDRLVDILAERCADEAAKKKIERLERQLKESFSGNYW